MYTQILTLDFIRILMQRRKVWVDEMYASQQQRKRSFFWWKMGIVFFCALGVALFLGSYAQNFKNMLSSATKEAITVVSKTVGTEMKRDQYGNVNVALIGYGGAHHGGGYLADSIIVASWNPEKWAVSMLSIPRDLYIKNPLGGASRINAVFSQLYGHYKKDIVQTASGFSAVLKDITGLEIPYYATIDFAGFKQVIDTVGGIEVNVPSSLHDSLYPDDNLRGYDSLHVEAGLQHMSWAIALKYARSRHAPGHASDFDRSLRQQLIIEWVKNKILSSESLSLDRLKALYGDLTQMIQTNISLDEMLWTAQYADKIKMFSFGMNVSYVPGSIYAMQKWAFLYNPPRDLFGWASVILPYGATPGNISHYEMINNYADFAAHVQGHLLDGAKISVDNGIGKETLRAQWMQNIKLATRVWAKMKRYGVNVIGSENNPNEHLLTTAYINVEWSESKWYEETIKALKNFLPIDQVVYNTGVQRTMLDEYGNEVVLYTGADVNVVLWASYLSGLQLQPYTEKLSIQYR